MDTFDDFLTPEIGESVDASPTSPLSTIPSLGDDNLPSTPQKESNEDDMMSFLMESPVAAPATTILPALTEKKTENIDDSFFDDLLSQPKPAEEESKLSPSLVDDSDPFAILEGPSTVMCATEEPSRVESPLEQDFLSWLDDSPAAPSLGASDSKPAGDPSTLGGMDDFFDEVFGEKSPELRQNSNQSSSSNPSTPNNFSNMKRFDSMLRAEASSGFPDVSRIRDVIISAGYLPQSCRGHVWSVLLVGGSVVEDQEAEFWRPSARDENNIENYAQLRSDCEALVKRAIDKSNLSLKPTNPEQCKEDLHDILLLYCIRKKAPYRSLLCDILSPLLFVPAPFSPPSRALSSSCFYSLSNNFIPLINLPATAYSRGIKTVHNWLHLLLSYHFPRLAQHLDRVFPGWEGEIHDATPAEIMNKRAYDIKSADLDRLERELGLIGDEDESQIKHSTEGQVIPSVRPSERRAGGCISSLWLCGIFGGCVPALYSCWLADWAILQGDRYAGIFFTAAFFGIYSDALQSMDGANIRKWIDKVLSGEPNWFSLLRLPLSAQNSGKSARDFLSDDLEEDTGAQVTWESFTRGWIHTAASLKASTPQGFTEAFEDMESWALAYSELNDEFDGYDSPHFPHGGVTGGSGSEKTVARIKAKVGEKSVKLMRTMRRLRAKMKKKGSATGSDSDSEQHNNSSHGAREDWTEVCHQESKRNHHCLWSSAAEVIPCICSSQRKPATATRDLLSSFRDGCEWVPGKTEMGVELKGGEGMSYPREDSVASPFFFGIDIRSQSEMALGRFPKAYCLDPRSLTDPDLIADCLATLEPMSEVTHLCIIGVGEEYIRQQSQGQQHGQGQQEDAMAMSLENMLAEYHNVLMSVAVFFTKKGFKNVSVLDGGFAAAARYLTRDDCPFKMSTALVDVQVSELDKLLGQGTCEKHLGTKRAVRPETTSSRETSREATDTAPSLSAGLAAVGSFVANVTGQPAAEVDTKQVLEDFGKKLTMFGSSTFATFKRVGAMGVASVTANAQGATTGAKSQTSSAAAAGGGGGRGGADGGVDMAAHGGSTWRDVGAYDERNALTFVIDEDDEDEDNDKPPAADAGAGVQGIPDTTKISITKTEAEKQQALAVHRLSGVTKGDELPISKETFPGAILFPAMKEKEVKDEEGKLIMVPGPDGETLQPVTASVHRYLVITKERFIVLDSQGKGVGSVATVKSNHHLTELIKITFKKRDPELVTLFYASPSPDAEGDVEGGVGAGAGPERSIGLKSHQYRVIKRKEFVETLQRNMTRFK